MLGAPHVVHTGNLDADCGASLVRF